MTICQRYLGPAGLEEDRYWMRRALASARRGLGATSPNPPVGAVLVKDRCLLAQGHHQKAGGPHAEVEAFAALRDPAEAEGGTLYVTLEPCSTEGRTPPCTAAIERHGVKRVVFGSVDPNPAHTGRGAEILRRAGIAVETGVLRAETDDLIRVFGHWIRHQRPYVMAKAGLSLDGCLTRPPGESSWLTSPQARQDAQQLRLLADGILVGAETIRQDDPKLTLRHPHVPPGKRPLRRYVLTRSGNVPPDARVMTDAYAPWTRVVRDASWPDWLDEAAAEGVCGLLIEGGGRTLTEAFQARAVHEMHFYLAPLLAGSGVTVIRQALGAQVSLSGVRYAVIGDDVKVSARLHYDSNDERV